MNALSGGEVDVGGAVSGHNVWTVDGAGSVLGVAGITKLGGISLSSGQSLTFTMATELADSTIVADGVTLRFPVETTLRNVNLTAKNAGQILFPVATSYTGYNWAHQTIQASGAGSRIDLGQLTALAGGGYDSYWDRTYYTYVNALSGGEVDVGGAVSGHNVWTVDGAGSVLGVAGVSSLGGYVSVSVSGGNRVEFSSVASLGNTNLAASSGGQILFPVATSYTGYNWGAPDDPGKRGGESDRLGPTHGIGGRRIRLVLGQDVLHVRERVERGRGGRWGRGERAQRVDGGRGGAACWAWRGSPS